MDRVMRIIVQPFSKESLGDFLQNALKGNFGDFHSFQAAVAFAKRSGVQHVADDIKKFVKNAQLVRIVVGIDQHGTSFEGLTELLDAVGTKGEIWINHDENPYVTFHPKVYLFEEDSSALLAIGSGNLTEGGLYSNDEAIGVFELDLTEDTDKEILIEIKEVIDKWCDEDIETSNQLNEDFLQKLVKEGYVKLEADLGRDISPDEKTKEDDGESQEPSKKRTTLFGRGKGRRRPPRRAKKSVPSTKTKIPIPSTSGPVISSGGFVMTLMKTDVGKGQTTPGTSRRSPEIFIPLKARNANSLFWEWESGFVESKTKWDRPGVKMFVGGKIVNVNMMCWKIKHDFRLRSEALRSSGDIGDIIRIEKTDGSRGFEYYVEIIPQGTTAYNTYAALCTNRVTNSQKRWGYY
jgi:HKD family nuclease